MVIMGPFGEFSEARVCKRVVGIGVSVDEVSAVAEILWRIPDDAPVSFVVIPVASRNRKVLSFEHLSDSFCLPVEIAQDGAALAPATVYVVPSRIKIAAVVSPGVLRLFSGKHVKGLGYSSLDHFFCSLAHVYKNDAIGILPSAILSHGCTGARYIRRHGGKVFSVFDGGEILNPERKGMFTGVVNVFAPARDIAGHVYRAVKG